MITGGRGDAKMERQQDLRGWLLFFVVAVVVVVDTVLILAEACGMLSSPLQAARPTDLYHICVAAVIGSLPYQSSRCVCPPDVLIHTRPAPLLTRMGEAQV